MACADCFFSTVHSAHLSHSDNGSDHRIGTDVVSTHGKYFAICDFRTEAEYDNGSVHK